MMYRHRAPRSSPRKRLHTSPSRNARSFTSTTENTIEDEEYWNKAKRRSKRNNDVCILSESPVNEKRLNENHNHSENNVRKLPLLTPEMESVIDRALQPKSSTEVLCQDFSISLTREDLKVLHGEEWLSDQIISFYLSLITERGKRRRYPSVFAFNTFFFTKLLSGRHPAVQRWTRKVDLFSFNIILIPVHKKKGHWCLAVIDFRYNKILYYDPVKRTNYTCLYALRDYLKEESLDKRKTTFDMNDWKYEHVKNVPIQESDDDCGVFILKYAEYYCRNAAVDFTQEDVKHFRRCMVYELLVKKLL